MQVPLFKPQTEWLPPEEFPDLSQYAEIAIDLEYPNVNIEHIPPKIVFTTFLNQEHGMDLSPEEVDTILKNR